MTPALGKRDGTFRAFSYWLFALFLPFAASCAGAPPSTQPQVNNLVVSGRFDRAVHILDTQSQAYGSNNELLYLLDRGLVFHLAGRYRESIEAFEKAKAVADALYTKSISGIAKTWLVNDYSAPYRGEDFERVMVHVFQALNYMALGNNEEALVEARQVDKKLTAINLQYKAGQKNVYREDAFIRFLMGILYEANRTKTDLNDAFIEYTRAAEIYERDYQPNYKLPVPQLLKQNILAAAQFMGPNEFDESRRKFGSVLFPSLKEKVGKAEIYLIQYNGLAPIKVQDSIPVPLPDGYLTKLAFPKYHSRYYETTSSRLIARNSGGKMFEAATETGEDIGAIAVKAWEVKKVRMMAKGVLRPLGKYALERAGGESIQEEQGDLPALLFRSASSLYNVYSEQADLRSWQTLPAEIRITRLLLDPGAYSFSVRDFDCENILLDEADLGESEVQAGERKFFIIRTVR